MEENAYYVTDETRVEQASAGLNATARDMARFGQLLLNNGEYNGKQILPSSITEEIKMFKKVNLQLALALPFLIIINGGFRTMNKVLSKC